jgi:Flp pilus assembly pilin Flp
LPTARNGETTGFWLRGLTGSVGVSGEVTVRNRSLPKPLRAKLAFWVESGQGLAEYGLILGLIALVSVAALTGFGAKVANEIGQVVNSF